MKIKLLIATAVLFSSVGIAQIKTPQSSPKGELEQIIGLTEIEVEYSRPSMRGRKIFGDVVPYGEMWRFGANSSTKIEFSDDVRIEGNKVDKGEYAIFAIPTETDWTIIFNKNLDINVWNYKQEDEAFRFTVTPTKLTEAVETFTIDFTEIRDGFGILSMSWENTRVSFKIKVDFDKEVMKQIDKVMAGPTAGELYQAARYYLENDKDLNQALTWINESIAKDQKEKYWVFRQKSLIQAKMGDFKGAIATAEKSLELAKADGDKAYISMNEKSIAEWKKK